MRLRTFGGLQLEGPDGPVSGASAQRRRLALLAVLAASERGWSRDSLLPLLWPESDEEHARHALAQLLYSIRRDLGEHVVRGDGGVLRLDSAVLSSDVADFHATLATREVERAASLNDAPFLDGFYLSGCPDFERWTEETRATLAARGREAVWEAAQRAMQRADPALASAWLERLAQQMPLDARYAMALMRAYAATGNTAAALEHARRHSAHVREEVGVEPDPQIARLVAELRAASGSPPGPHVARPATAPRASDATDATDATDAGSADDPPTAGESTATRSKDATEALNGPANARVGGRGRWWAAAAAVVAIGAGFTWWRTVASHDTALPARWVIVADVENETGDEVFDRTVPVALSASIAQSAKLLVLPPDRVRETLERMRRPGADSVLDLPLAREVATREGAALVVVPSVERSGAGYDLSVRAVDPADGSIRAFVAEHAAQRESVIETLDVLGRELRRALGESRRSVAQGSLPLPRVTTQSLDALKRYADGTRAWNELRAQDASARWREAVALDSSFALAHAALGSAAFWLNQPTEGERHYRRALALLDPLPDREQVRVRADFERARGNYDGAIAILHPWVATHPDDLVLLSALGYAYFRLARNTEASDAFTRLTTLDSLDHLSLLNLAAIEKRLGRYPESIAAYRRAFALVPSLETANSNINLEFAQAFVLGGLPDSAEARFAALMASGDAPRRARGLRSLAFLDLWRGRFGSAAGRLEAAATITERERLGVSEVRDRLLLASALEAVGRQREQRRALARAYAVVVTLQPEPTLLFWSGKALARAGMVREAARVLALLERAARPEVRGHRVALAALQGELMLARGSTGEALAKLRTAVSQDSTSHVLESLAFCLASADSLGAAATEYQRLAGRREFGWEGQLLTGGARWNLGRVQEQRGERSAAIESYRRFDEEWRTADSAYIALADARMRLGRLRKEGG